MIFYHENLCYFITYYQDFFMPNEFLTRIYFTDSIYNKFVNYARRGRVCEEKTTYVVLWFWIYHFFSSFLTSNTAVEDRSLGKFLRWLINEQNGTFFGMKLPTGFQLIGQTTLQQYRAWLDYFDRQSKLENRSFVTRTTKRAYARIGVCFLIHFYPNLRYFQ